mmetsp:Transcript_7615/g.9505  ORF Transcript_7615/g.9505 Transcript_7615/m.9505 type:complete len:191 (+) Transcript_7615:89-661(+)
MPKKKSRAPVTVVAAPSSSFPDFSTFSAYNTSGSSSNGGGSKKKKNAFGKNGNDNDNNNNNANDRNSKIGIDIDFDETVKEIKTLGSTQFTGKQKRKYEKEQYEELTGRTKKKQKVPLNIVRGIKKKAAIRERRLEQENKDAGIVTATTNKKKTKRGYSEQNRRDNRVHGPAPTIGFTKKGILSVRREKR